MGTEQLEASYTLRQEKLWQEALLQAYADGYLAGANYEDVDIPGLLDGDLYAYAIDHPQLQNLRVGELGQMIRKITTEIKN